eukprot:COSAG06_NODE_42952_length_376_cov_6.451264_1_plen_67_part_10
MPCLLRPEPVLATDRRGLDPRVRSEAAAATTAAAAAAAQGVVAPHSSSRHPLGVSAREREQADAVRV